MPAMPCNKSIDTHESWEDLTAGGRFVPADGLTKREMFAIHAMQGLLASSSDNNGQWTHTGPNDMAREAVEFADALLKELEK